MPVIHFDLGLVAIFRSQPGIGEILDPAVVVEIQHHEFSIVQFQFKTIQPEPIVLGVGVPRTGFRLPVPNNGPFHARRPDLVGLRQLLRDSYPGSRREDLLKQWHTLEYTQQVYVAGPTIARVAWDLHSWPILRAMSSWTVAVSSD